jgi:hypothetical protein
MYEDMPASHVQELFDKVLGAGVASDEETFKKVLRERMELGFNRDAEYVFKRDLRKAVIAQGATVNEQILTNKLNQRIKIVNTTINKIEGGKSTDVIISERTNLDTGEKTIRTFEKPGIGQRRSMTGGFNTYDEQTLNKNFEKKINEEYNKLINNPIIKKNPETIGFIKKITNNLKIYNKSKGFILNKIGVGNYNKKELTQTYQDLMKEKEEVLKQFNKIQEKYSHKDLTEDEYNNYQREISPIIAKNTFLRKKIEIFLDNIPENFKGTDIEYNLVGGEKVVVPTLKDLSPTSMLKSSVVIFIIYF